MCFYYIRIVIECFSRGSAACLQGNKLLYLLAGIEFHKGPGSFLVFGITADTHLPAPQRRVAFIISEMGQSRDAHSSRY